MPMFNVGETVIWHSAVGPVEAEYRGVVDGDRACIIVRDSLPYQTVVSPHELAKKDPD